jgi:hypothetical protein
MKNIILSDSTRRPRFTIFPHGALTKYRRRPTRPLEESESIENQAVSDAEGVTVIGTAKRPDRYVEMELETIERYDARDLDAENLNGSEGVAPMELADFITSVSVNSSIAPPYGSLAVNLSLTAKEAHSFLGGVGSHSMDAMRDPSLRTDYDFRNLCSGAWVVLKADNNRFADFDSKALSFFGKVSSVSVTQMANDGVPLFMVALTCTSFFEPLIMNEIKQTLRRDKSIEGIHSSAIFATSDYTAGFLKSLMDDFALKTASQPSLFLKKVINTLVTIDLPASLTFDLNRPRTWYTLGDLIQVVDGSTEEMGKYGMRGADVDVIKGKILNSYQGSAVNNMTHASVIEQMFRPMPELMEMFAHMVYLSDEELKTLAVKYNDKAIINVYKRIGGIPVIVYRYRPVYPYAPPTAQGNLIRERALDSRAKSRPGKTAAEEFFGEMEAVPFSPSESTGQIYIVSAAHEIVNLQYSTNESERLNYVFVEQAFTNGQAQNSNLARNNARPTLNVKDINRHGLRSMSTHTPFISTSDDKEDRKSFNLEAANAIAERIYHTLGMGHQFLSGQMTITTQLQSSLFNVPVGSWATFPDVGGQPFTCYITDITIISTGGEVTTTSTIVTFERGHYGLLAPAYDYQTTAVEYDININLLEELNKDRRLT